jgi:hypothetical protein
MRGLNVRKPWNFLAIGLFVLVSFSLLSAQSWPELPTSRRLRAQRLWSERKFANYRVSVRVEYWGSVCSQEIEVEGEQLRRTVRNDCRLSWLSLMTIARLFEISESLDHPIPCFIATQTCSCYRVRSAEVAYDSQLGYPRTISYRREIKPNLLHLDYWRRLWETRRFPECEPTSPAVRITVTSVRPLA